METVSPRPVEGDICGVECLGCGASRDTHGSAALTPDYVRGFAEDHAGHRVRSKVLEDGRWSWNDGILLEPRLEQEIALTSDSEA